MESNFYYLLKQAPRLSPRAARNSGSRGGQRSKHIGERGGSHWPGIPGSGWNGAAYQFQRLNLDRMNNLERLISDSHLPPRVSYPPLLSTAVECSERAVSRQETFAAIRTPLGFFPKAGIKFYSVRQSGFAFTLQNDFETPSIHLAHSLLFVEGS